MARARAGNSAHDRTVCNNRARAITRVDITAIMSWIHDVCVCVCMCVNKPTDYQTDSICGPLKAPVFGYSSRDLAGFKPAILGVSPLVAL